MIKKSTFVNLLLLLVTLSAVIICCDIVLRWYFKIPSRYLNKIVYFDNSLVPAKRLKSNADVWLEGAFKEFKFHVTTSEEGFRRTTPYALNDHSNLDVILLGDSQTFGVGVDDGQTISSFLSTDLKVPILNASCPGYNNIEQYLLIKSLLKKYHPKHLILNFFPGNDPYENFVNRKMLSNPVNREDLPLNETKKKQNLSLASVKSFLKKNSSIFNLLIRLRQIEWLNALLYRYELVNASKPNELVVFERNDSEQKQKYWKAWVSKYRLNLADFDLLAPNKHTLAFCYEQGIRCVDLTPALRNAYHTDQEIYWKIDNHLASNGNYVIATMLRSYLKH
jgi:hypothetical protein